MMPPAGPAQALSRYQPVIDLPPCSAVEPKRRSSPATRIGVLLVSWRWRRDLNPRRFSPHALSRSAIGLFRRLSPRARGLPGPKKVPVNVSEQRRLRLAIRLLLTGSARSWPQGRRRSHDGRPVGGHGHHGPPRSPSSRSCWSSGCWPSRSKTWRWPCRTTAAPAAGSRSAPQTSG